jgi:hypothetical protein
LDPPGSNDHWGRIAGAAITHLTTSNNLLSGSASDGDAIRIARILGAFSRRPPLRICESQ